MKKHSSNGSRFFVAFFGLFPALAAVITTVLVVLFLASLSLLFGTSALYRSHAFLYFMLRFGIVMLSAVVAVGTAAFVLLKRGIRPAEYPAALGIAVGVGAGVLMTDLNFSGQPGNLLLWSPAVANLIWAVILFNNKDYRPDGIITPPGTHSAG